MIEIISRKVAKKLGKKRYYDGKLCINGHYSQRYTSTCQCLKCNTNKANKWYSENREKVLQEYHENKLEKVT